MGIIGIILVHQREGRVVVGVEKESFVRSILQLDIDDQIVGDEHARVELSVNIRCDAIHL